MKKLVLIVFLLIPFGMVHAQQYSHYAEIKNPDHSQGNDFQCATGTSLELLCEIENVLKYFFPQIIQIGNTQEQDLKQIIKNQEQEINLLQQIVNQNKNPISQNTIKTNIQNCIKQGTGLLCHQ